MEVRVGGSLTRHDLGVTQTGPDTITTMKHFLLAGAGQLQDLHSRLRLDFPRGKANQLHKCIASAATGRGVFDGNVKVRLEYGALCCVAVVVVLSRLWLGSGNTVGGVTVSQNSCCHSKLLWSWVAIVSATA